MGPNDARRVIWAIGMSFPFSRGFFLLVLTIIFSLYLCHEDEGTERAAMTRTGPNDVTSNDHRYVSLVFFFFKNLLTNNFYYI